jgi:hypothetical protein
MKHCLLVFAAVLALAIGVPASAQSIFLDVNGDGICSNLDVLSASTTSVDVYFDTNHTLSGASSTCPTGEALTINSYTFILSAPTGGVTYGAWTDNMGFTINAGGGQAGNDVWVAKASGTPVAPGKYKVGSLAITVTGSPRLEIHAASSIDPTAITSFGSACPGQDFDNTMKLPTDISPTNICGTASGTPTQETTWGKIKNLYRN